MALSLQKGGNLSLSKAAPNLTHILIGLGWDVRTTDGAAFDLDASLFMLGENGKVRSDADFIFYNQAKSSCGSVEHTGDNRTGAGDGDDEQIIVKLNNLSDKYQRILFVVSIYEGRQRAQHFGQLKNAFIRAVDNKGKELCRYDISAESHYDNMCVMTFAEVVREAGGWGFKALGTAHQGDGFVDVLRSYIG